jgi:hypothetical protein
MALEIPARMNQPRNGQASEPQSRVQSAPAERPAATPRFEDHLPARLRDVDTLLSGVAGEGPCGAWVIEELFAELHALAGAAAVFGYSELGRVAYGMQAILAPHRSTAQVPPDVVEALLGEQVRLKHAATLPDPHR